GEAESAVSIRSSATSEDSKSTSFAGQYKTVLNVVGIQALLKAIEDCVSSASRPDLNSYRRQFRDDDTGIAILIQKFVDSEASCVLFTANPVTQDRREIIINSNWGLGESIVSGIVTPDSFVIEKRSLRIIRRDIAKKLVRTVPFREGVHEVEMPSELQTRPSLSEQQLLDVSRLGVSLEQFMGWPADIECSFAGNILYLLQCRPITSFLRGTH